MVRTILLLALAVAAALAVPTTHLPAGHDLSQIEHEIQHIIDTRAVKYNCSFSVAIQLDKDSSHTFAGGVIDDKGTQADTTDKYVWGSVTKTWTGAYVMQLIDKGFFGLDDTAFGLIDPILTRLTNQTMVSLFGGEVEKVTVRHLLGMQSGIPDFDTAKPYPRPPTDAFREETYQNPTHDYTPIELLSVPWVKTGKLLFTPGNKTSYSSTNFILLGFLLGGQQNITEFDQLDQSHLLPPTILKQYKPKPTFATHGPPSQHTTVHGYDGTTYNNQTGRFDVFGVSGVFAGWTASDFVSTAENAARFAFDVFGPEHRVVSAKGVSEMIPTNAFYGLATFNLSHTTGHNGTYGRAYGHLGATFGYQSIVSYFPGLEMSISVGTNLETDNQPHPTDVLCVVYNRVKNFLLDEPVQTCEFVVGSYYFGTCNCTGPALP